MYQKSHFKYLYDVFLHVIIAVQWLSLLQFSCSVMSNQLWLHGLHHAKLPCPPPSPRVCSNSCSWSQWCHPTISSSVVPFSSCLQSFPASGFFLISQFFASGGQSIRTSASASVLPMNISFRMDWLDLLAGEKSPGDSQQSSPTSQFKSISSLALSLLYGPNVTFIHDCWTNDSLDYMDLCRQSNVSAF